MRRLLITTIVFLAGIAEAHPPQNIIRVSPHSSQRPWVGDGFHPCISGDGRYIGYYSNVPDAHENLVNPTNIPLNIPSVYVYDRIDGTITLASVPLERVGYPNLSSPRAPRIQSCSLDMSGNFIAFDMRTTNLVRPLVSHGNWHIFLRDLQNNQTTYISNVGEDWLETALRRFFPVDYENEGAHGPKISGSGRYVVYDAGSTLSAPTSPQSIFIYDHQTQRTVQLPTSQINGRRVNRFSISADGRFVVYTSSEGFFNSRPILLYDRDTDNDGIFDEPGAIATTTIVNNEGDRSSVSADGNSVAFERASWNRFGSELFINVYVFDRLTGQTTLISKDSQGQPGNGWSSFPGISGDGRFIVYESQATNLTSEEDANGKADIFLYDRLLDRTTLLSVNATGAQGNENSGYPVISTDGHFVSFESSANNLVELVELEDTNMTSDVFLVQLSSPTHLACVNNACARVEGAGVDSCQTNTDCQPPPPPPPPPQIHSECRNQTCVQVEGPGTNACQADRDCLEFRSFACMDSDNGNDSNRTGIVRQYIDSDPPISFNDECRRNEFLKEYFCNARTGQYEYQWYFCKLCQNGACDPSSGFVSPVSESEVPE